MANSKTRGPVGVGSIYQLKVMITGTEPPVWRKVEIPKNANLGTLHDAIQGAFGWYDSHLHEFEIFGSSYGVPDEDDADFGLEVHDERRGKLGNLVQPGAKFTYTYDFGDSWEHEITVEKIVDAQPGVSYPRCTAAERACPPEDCGGVGGYADFLEAISDPTHEEHEGLLEWVGGEFDPDYVDLTGTNKTLEALGRPVA